MKPRTIQVEQIDHAASGAAIRELREKKGILLRELAEKLKITVPYLSDLERGNRTWTPERFAEVAKLLKSMPKKS